MKIFKNDVCTHEKTKSSPAQLQYQFVNVMLMLCNTNKAKDDLLDNLLIKKRIEFVFFTEEMHKEDIMKISRKQKEMSTYAILKQNLIMCKCRESINI